MKTKLFNVLIAEDEDIIRNGLLRAVNWQEKNLCPIAARHGREALEIFCNQHIDMVITDIKMPFMDGIELIEEIRKISTDIPIVILSGYDDFTFAQQAIHLGASEYLLKPLVMEDFLPLLDSFYNELVKKQQSSLESPDRIKLLRALNAKSNYECILPYLNNNTIFTFCFIRINNYKNHLLADDYLALLDVDSLINEQFTNFIKAFSYS